MEILFFIGGFFLLFILIAPLINAFGSNSPHKDKSQAEKKEQALKDIKKNYNTSKDLLFKGLQAIHEGAAQLEKLTAEWDDKADKYQKEEYEKDYHRMKAVCKEQNNKRKEVGLEEVSLVEFFEYNKDYQERARKELEALEAKKRGERLALLIEEHNKLEIESKNKELKTKVASEESLKKRHSIRVDNESKTPQLAPQNCPPIPATSSRILDIKLDALPKGLVEFIYIRYYLTGEKSLPKLKCIYDSWEKSIYANSELNEAQWNKIIEQMSFNPSKLKKIDAIYHFTHKDNLLSILTRGLLTKKTLDEQHLEYKYNDEKRLDGIKDSISLSFSHPNWKMFYKYRVMIGLEDWVVLKISPELLSGNTNPDLSLLNDFDYLDKAIFCKKNAAHFTERTKTTEERKSHKVFLDIFESTIDIELLTYPYLNESEILYQGNIPKEFIQEIHVIEQDPELLWVHGLGFKVSINKTVFEKR
ncbi:DarT ssDNA thymidine ADP-ribosyltransferase family protein [Acinetobacter sp. YH12090]|uniref:DarT ssDNA thymidine ADP-ribosyltransferase family protein n=1 Tax=Acinetobacter sp. YH12090 TaxID=2601081 RepID=UPI0015D243A1|nr:DarT ssDNA thymidine ADP-ribosyltransferase family protein [Acinetobacter sp. YH12090]